jgi:hypothetical protein
MLEEIKKIGNLLLTQTKDQKDILLLNLKLKSFSNKLDSAFTRLGKLAYPTLKDRDLSSSDNEELEKLIDEIRSIEDEVKEAGAQLEKSESESAELRGKMTEEVGTAWTKAKESMARLKEEFSGKIKSAAKADDAGEPSEAGSADGAKEEASGEQAAKTEAEATVTESAVEEAPQETAEEKAGEPSAGETAAEGAVPGEAEPAEKTEPQETSEQPPGAESRE